MDSTRALACIAVLVCSLWIAGSVAQLSVWAVPPVHPQRLAMSGPLSLDQAVRLTQERYKGRVVRCETLQDGGRTVYVLRVLSNKGHVWTVRVDAADATIR
jgi:uncharacterized membrane protein YkoI